MLAAIRAESPSAIPDFRNEPDKYFPPQLLRLMFGPERETVGRGICAALLVVDRRNYVLNRRGDDENETLYFNCGRAGKPTSQVVVLRNSHSKKCGCKAKFQISKRGVVFKLDHCEECLPEAEGSETRETRSWLTTLASQYPGLEQELVDFAVELYNGDDAIRPRNIKRQICNRLSTKGIVNPPESAIKSIISRAIRIALDQVPIKESLNRLFEKLSNDPNLVYAKKIAETMSGPVVTAIHIHSKTIAPPPDYQYAPTPQVGPTRRGGTRRDPMASETASPSWSPPPPPTWAAGLTA